MRRMWRAGICVIGCMALVGCGAKAAGGGGAADSGAASTSDAGATADAGSSATDAGGGDAATSGGGDAASSGGGDAATSGGGEAGADAGPACTKPELGVCDGTTVSWCEDGKDQTLDCKQAYEDVGAATCAEVSKSWGHDCVIATGESCSYEEDGEFDWAFCAGQGAGCVIGTEEATCATGVAACKETDIDQCLGDLLVFDCAAGQPLAVDCKVLGGGCGKGAQDAACTQLPEGAPCDGELLLCADGLTCEGATAEDDGTCKKKT